MKVEFVTSAVDRAGFPREPLPELAMAGRSNVGKSSLINALARQKVARTSAAPGKTRSPISTACRERVRPRSTWSISPGTDTRAAATRRGASSMTLPTPTSIRGAAVERRVGSSGWCCWSTAGIRTLTRITGHGSGCAVWAPTPIVVATKLDKLTRQERVRHLGALEERHQGPVVGVSAQTGEGLKDLWKTIDRLLKQPPLTKEPPPQ